MRIIVISILLFISMSVKLISQIDENNDILMGNIELLNSKIKDLNLKLTSLRSKLVSVNDDLHTFIGTQKTQNTNLLNKINTLVEEFEKINVDYKATLKQIELFREENKKQEEKISFMIIDLQSLTAETAKQAELIDSLTTKLNKLPDLYLNPEAIPKFGVNLSLVKFFTFGLSNLNVEPVYSLGGSFKLSREFALQGEFTSPFVLSLSAAESNTGKVSDRWNAQVYSLGLEYSLAFNERPNLNLLLLGGIFYASLNYDTYANSTMDIDRNNTSGIETFGANIRLGLSYNQFDLKNPIEFYVFLNNQISMKNIVLKTDPNNKFDLGAYLLSVSIGLRFHFW